MDEKNILIKLQINDTDVKNKFEEIVNSVQGLEILDPEDTSRADLLIFELENDIEKECQLIWSFLDTDAVGEVFLTSKNYSPDNLIKALKIGAKEFFSHPLDEEEVTEALQKFVERKEELLRSQFKKPGQIITVVGSKGGVGTSTIAVNLAVSVAEKNKDKMVALLDINMLFGEIPLFLQIEPKYHWGEIITNISRLDVTFLKNVLTEHSSGVYVLPSPSYFADELFTFSAASATSEFMERLLVLMQKMFDFVIIDAGRALDELVLKIFGMSGDIFLISTQSIPSLSNTNKIIKALSKMGYLEKEHISVVMNRYLKNSDIPLEDAEAGIDKKIFWSIPNDYTTTTSAINQGKTLSEIAPKAEITKSIQGLADTLLKEEKSCKTSLAKFFSR